MSVVLALLLGLVVGLVFGVVFGFAWAGRSSVDVVQRICGDVIEENKRLKREATVTLGGEPEHE